MTISLAPMRVVLLGCVGVLSFSALAASSVDDALQSLNVNTTGNLQHSTLPADAYTLLRATGSQALLNDDTTATPEVRARAFLGQFGAVMGVTDAQAQLELARISHDRLGNIHVHLDQRHAGLPVFAARLIVHMDDRGIRGVNGVFLRDLAGISSQENFTATALEERALQTVQKTYPDADLSVSSSQLMIYRAGLLRSIPGRDYLAREVIIVSSKGDVKERVLLDAAQGGLINQINEIHTVKNREIYTPNQDVPPVLTEGSAIAPADVPLSGDSPSNPASRVPRSPQDNLYIFAGGTYDLYSNLFGHEGYDDGVTAMEDQVQKSVYLINDACPNAYWNGDSTNYCPGFDVDDVVSHEWSHAYTSYTHGLIYQYQSGALNEAYSDIFGETYDLVNGLEGQLGVNLDESAYYENGGSRWVVGEDLSEPAALALLRDMWNPDAFGYVPGTTIPVYNGPSPGSVITSPNYYCGSDDGGGVHTNSGVPNHAYAMLVDGKEFNGVNIPQIGMTRAAHIYFHAMVNYQTPSTNFAQHAEALAQSCLDLIGAPLNDVLGNASSDVITNETCAAVEAAIVATELRNSPVEKCDYKPLLQPESNTPALCPAGQNAVVDFIEDWEGGTIPEAWSVTQNITGDTDEGTTWLISDDLPTPHTGSAAFVANTFGGTCAPGGDISASFQLDSPEITVTETRSVFSMNHFMQSEFGYDGGNLKFSLNGADFELVPSSAMSHSPYNTSLETGSGDIPDPVGLFSGGNTNPIAGQDAWSGSDEGESQSNWGFSFVQLDALGVSPGDSIRFRFEFGQDGCNGNLGWFVDEVAVSHCSADAPSRDQTFVPVTQVGNTSGRGGALGLWLLIISLMGGLLGRRARLAD